MLLHNNPGFGHIRGMKNLVSICALVASLAALPAAANAACYADYKAKKDAPLTLSYGVIQLSDAACSDYVLAGDLTRERIKVGGWTLLRLISLFGPEGLEQRKDSAAGFFLLY